MTYEEMFKAIQVGTVTLEEFEDWLTKQQMDYESFCDYEASTYIDWYLKITLDK